jgi:1,4-alpha-glucan branching enzyme
MSLVRLDEQVDRVLVSFRIPPGMGGSHVVVAGDFNGWSPSATPMAPDPDEPEALRVDVELSPGRRYRFRYIIDGDRWANDWEADDYVPNDYGGEDSVIDLERFVPAAPPGPVPFGG